MSKCHYVSDGEAPTLLEGEFYLPRLTEDGILRVSSEGSGGGGDASAANQLTEITLLGDINGKTSLIRDDVDATRIASQSMDTKLTNQATAANQADILSAIQGVNSKILQADLTNGVLPVIARPVALDTYTLLQFSNAGLNNTLNVKNVLGNVYCISFINKNIATRYFQLWNTDSTAGNGTLLEEFQVAGNTQLILGTEYFHANGLHFDTGIAFGFSSTSNTFTGATAADQSSRIRYL